MIIYPPTKYKTQKKTFCKKEAHGPPPSPEKQFQLINSIAQSYVDLEKIIIS